MKKTLLIIFFLLLPVNSNAGNISKVYFAGGCFWCMEESNTTGHYETLKITYDSSIINFKQLLEIYWVNIDPFDADGQFCDKGESYKSVVFFEDSDQKKIIEASIKNIENKFNKKVVTYVKKFKEFYIAETYHQDYYEKNFIRYLMYKKGCQREETLNKIWG